MANDREITATLGVPVRRVEAAAWLGSGLLSGIAGIMLANLSGFDDTNLVFTVLISSLAASLIGRLRSIPVTFAAALVIGLVHDLITPINQIGSYQDMTPVRAGRDRPAGHVAHVGHDPLARGRVRPQ